MSDFYSWLEEALEREYEPVRLLKESQRGSVRLLRHLGTGKLAILRRFTGSAEVYRKLREIRCPHLPLVYEVASREGRHLELEELLAQRLIIREPGSGTREILEKMLQQFSYGVGSFSHVSQISSFTTIKSLVAGGEGITFLYRPAAEHELAEGVLTEMDIEGFPLLREFNFVMPEGVPPEERHLNFHNFCRKFL